jgi:hypothetical protein
MFLELQSRLPAMTDVGSIDVPDPVLTRLDPVTIGERHRKTIGQVDRVAAGHERGPGCGAIGPGLGFRRTSMWVSRIAEVRLMRTPGTHSEAACTPRREVGMGTGVQRTRQKCRRP